MLVVIPWEPRRVRHAPPRRGQFAPRLRVAHDRSLIVRKHAGIGARLPTYRLTTRNNAMMAAWLVVIEYRLQMWTAPHLSGL